MSIRIFLMDDQQHAMDLIAAHAEKMPGVEIVGMETKPEKALSMILDREVIADAVYLDIDMPGLGGMELASLVKHMIQIVFTTAHRQFAAESYTYDAVEYLLKPITFERFIVSIQKLKDKLNSQQAINQEAEDTISIPGDGKGAFIVLETKSIRYIQGSSNYVIIYTGEKSYMTNYSMAKIEELLRHHKFLRVHKSYIVNLKRIVKADSELIYLDNEKEIPIGETYRKQFINLMKPK